MRSPSFELIRMNAAETRASSAIAVWTPLAVVWRSWTTAEIDTFMNDVSTTRTNIAAARRTANRGLVTLPADAAFSDSALIPALGYDGRLTWVAGTDKPEKNAGLSCDSGQLARIFDF